MRHVCQSDEVKESDVIDQQEEVSEEREVPSWPATEI